MICGARATITARLEILVAAAATRRSATASGVLHSRPMRSSAALTHGQPQENGCLIVAKLNGDTNENEPIAAALASLASVDLSKIDVRDLVSRYHTEARMKTNRRAKRSVPPWRRYVVFCPDGTPTGWAMGMSEDSAIRAWLEPFKLADDKREAAWAHQLQSGYSVRAVDLTPAMEPAMEPADAA